MGITDAFRLLNNSIRGIRQNEMRHEERMLRGRIREQALINDLNDPLKKEARQRAALNIIPREIDAGTYFSTEGKNQYQIDVWNNETLPELNKAAPSDAEFNKAGKLVYKGTDNPYMAPSWRAAEIEAKANLMIAMGGYEDKALKKEKDALTYQISALETEAKNAKGTGDPNSKNVLGDTKRMRLGKLKERLGVVSGALANDDVTAKSLLSANQKLMKGLDRLYKMPTRDEKMISSVMSRIDANTKMLSSLQKKTKQNYREYNYFYKNTKGEVINRKLVYPEGTTPPLFMKWGTDANKYTLGTYKAPTKDGAGAITNVQMNTINKEYTNIKNVIAGTADKAATEKVITSLVLEGYKGGNRELITELVTSASEEVIENLSDRLTNMERLYENDPRFIKKDIEARKDREIRNTLGLTKPK